MLVVAVALAAGDARAEPPRPLPAMPQANAGLTLGGAAVRSEGEPWHPELQLGLRGDVLFGRDHVGTFGVGPYGEIGTLAFNQLQVETGASLLLPVHELFPVVVSLGTFGRIGPVPVPDGLPLGDTTFEPGVSGSLFWGNRSFNFHSSYVMAAGLLVSYRQSLGPSRESALVLSAQLDLAVLTLPVVMLIDVLRGDSPEAAPIASARGRAGTNPAPTSLPTPPF